NEGEGAGWEVLSLAVVRACMASVPQSEFQTAPPPYNRTRATRQRHTGAGGAVPGWNFSRFRLVQQGATTKIPQSSPLVPPPPSPSPPSAVSTLAPCAGEARPLAPGEATQLAAQVLHGVRPHGLALSAEHREPHRPVEWRQVPRLEPPRLALLQTHPHHPHS